MLCSSRTRRPRCWAGVTPARPGGSCAGARSPADERNRAAVVAFRIKPGEALPHAIRRMARAELADARDVVTAPRRSVDERVHDLRTAIKKVRALIRMVKPEAPRRRIRGADRRLKNVADAVSGARDAEVVLTTFDGVVRAMHESPGGSLAQARTRARRDGRRASVGQRRRLSRLAASGEDAPPSGPRPRARRAAQTQAARGRPRSPGRPARRGARSDRPRRDHSRGASLPPRRAPLRPSAAPDRPAPLPPARPSAPDRRKALRRTPLRFPRLAARRLPRLPPADRRPLTVVGTC